MAPPIGLIFFGRGGDSPGERLVREAQLAATAATAVRLRAAGVERIVLATDAAPSSPTLARLGVEVDEQPGEFHFGRRLAGLVRRLGAQRVAYFGAGSASLATDETLRALIAPSLVAEEPLVVANNCYSTDFCAFNHAQRVADLAAEATVDNNLAWLLKQHGFAAQELPRSTATQFDLDTPTDALIYALRPEAPPAIQRHAAQRSALLERLERAMEVVVAPRAHLFVGGRVASRTWAYLETETACSVRVLSEERGMKASGRDVRGEVVSLLGLLVDAAGPARSFTDLARLAQASFVDTRVLLAHAQRWPSAADRFAADLLDWPVIADPYLRDLAQAAAEARGGAIVLGGHGLVNAGLMALVEEAWRRNDERLGRGG